jgi:hypothetical protein
MNKKYLDILYKISLCENITFEDLTFPTLEEAIDYKVDFDDMSREDAEKLVYSRNFCDLKDVFRMQGLGLVEELPENYPKVAFKITDYGRKLVRDKKIEELFKDE